MQGQTTQSWILGVLVGAFSTLSVHQAVADVFYVDSTPPRGDGSSWKDALVDLQDALGAASAGDEIWVAEGTYTPSDSDATASFVLPPGVALYGGFAGHESTRNERDWAANETILSGDIGRDDIVSPWPSGWNIDTANAGHVVVASGTNRDTLLDGFTIANGHTGPAGTPAGHELMYGSGVYIVEGSPTIRHCTFRHNLAAFASGGGLYCRDGNPRVDSCTFIQNYAHGGGGGGMFVYGNSLPAITRCEFRDNISVATSISNVDGDAAGLGVYSANWVTISDCRFEGNVARPFYSIGDELGYGGGLWAWDGGITVDGCTFVNNRANYGAGLITWGPALVVNSLFRNNTAVVQPNDPYPEQGGDGAAIAAWSAGSDFVDVINCTIAFNRGKKYAGAVAFWNAQINGHNSIVRNNTAAHPETVDTWKEQVVGFNELAYSNVSHIFEPHAPGEDPIDPADLPGVIDAEPMFVDPSSLGDLHLLPGSPCIDAGNNAVVPAGTLGDLDGNARFVNEPTVPDTGAGDAAIVDMGAFEFRVMYDYDRDGDVDLLDWAMLFDCSSGPNVVPTSLIAQLDLCIYAFDGELDNDIDLQDFASFQAMFGPDK